MNELSLMQTENQEKDGPIRRNISSYTFFNIFADFLWVTITMAKSNHFVK